MDIEYPFFYYFTSKTRAKPQYSTVLSSDFVIFEQKIHITQYSHILLHSMHCHIL